MKFEPIITLGTLVQAAVFIVTIAIGYSKFVSRMAKLEAKVNMMWTAFSAKFIVKDQQRFFDEEE